MASKLVAAMIRLSDSSCSRNCRNEFSTRRDGLSHAELCRACDQAAKLAVLADRREIAKAELEQSIQTFRERKQAIR